MGVKLIPADKVKELIRGTLSVDTDEDKEYVCSLIDEIDSGWISVKDRLPESGEPVLVTCEIHSLYGNKMRYVCEAFHAEKYSVREGNLEATDCYDYCEEDDEYYLMEGWYEIIHNWDEYGSVVIGDFVTHWMPRPEPAEEVTDGTALLAVKRG